MYDQFGNYLRVRGEYSSWLRISPIKEELPPRARRIQHPRSDHHINHRTTSACAENTAMLYPPSVPIGNYLRVRGEYLLGRRP